MGYMMKIYLHRDGHNNYGNVILKLMDLFQNPHSSLSMDCIPKILYIICCRMEFCKNDIEIDLQPY